MDRSPTGQVTQLLHDVEEGKPQAAGALLPLVSTTSSASWPATAWRRSGGGIRSRRRPWSTKRFSGWSGTGRSGGRNWSATDDADAICAQEGSNQIPFENNETGPAV